MPVVAAVHSSATPPASAHHLDKRQVTAPFPQKCFLRCIHINYSVLKIYFLLYQMIWINFLRSLKATKCSSTTTHSVMMIAVKGIICLFIILDLIKKAYIQNVQRFLVAR